MATKLNGKQKRNVRGQGIVEGVAGTVLVITAIALGVALLVNTGLAIFYKQKLGYVAQAISVYLQSRADWLGCTRPDYNPAKAQAEARKAADVMLENLGMPPLSDIKFDEFAIKGQRFCRVTITVNQLRLPGGACLPAAISMAESGVSVDYSGDCWGFAWMRFHEPARGMDRGMLVPVLAICPNKTNFDSSSKYSCKIRGTNFNCAVQVPNALVSSPLLSTSPGQQGRAVAP